MCTALCAPSSRTAPSFAAYPQRLVVVARYEEAEDVVSLVLVPVPGTALLPFTPGQAIHLGLLPDASCGGTTVPLVDRPVVQPRACTYSLSDAPHETHYRITVKRTPPADAFRCGSFAHDHWPVGTVLRASAPQGRLTLPAPAPADVVLVAAGIGLTPFVSIVAHLAGTGQLAAGPGRAGGTRVRLRYTTAHPGAHPFRAEFARLAAAHPGLDVRTWYSRAARLTAEAFRASLPGLAAADQVLVCGPPGFVHDVEGWLAAASVAPARVRVEGFGSGTPGEPRAGETGAGAPADRDAGTAAPSGRAPVVPPRPRGAAAEVVSSPLGDLPPEPAVPRVTFARAGVTVPWTGAVATLLELAEEAGLEPDYRCRAGLCGTCRTPLARGQVRYVTPPQYPVPVGEVLTCVARPATDVVLDL